MWGAFESSFINTIFSCNFPLADALKCIEDASDGLPIGTPGSASAKINAKITYILEKNKSFHTRRLIKEPLTSEDLTYFKFSPTTSCFEESSFSVYKTLNCTNRQSFEFQNMYFFLDAMFSWSSLLFKQWNSIYDKKYFFRHIFLLLSTYV